MQGETIDQFATRLHQLAASCEFTDVDKEIKSAIIQHCQSKRLRRYSLREDDVTLNLLAKARSLETSEKQAAGMEVIPPQEKQSQDINFMRRRPRKQGPQMRKSQSFSSPKQGSQQASQASTTCRKCGQGWPHKQGPCPAKGRTCRKCGKPDHFAKMCLTPVHRTQNTGHRQEVKVVTEEDHKSSSSDEEYFYSTTRDRSKIPTVTVRINEVETEMIVDTRASTDIIDESTLQQVDPENKITLQPTTKRLFAYGSTSQLPTLGKFTGNISFQNNEQMVAIHVMKGSHGSLLSYRTATALGILDIRIQHIQDPLQDSLATKFPNLFQGIGQLKDVEVSYT